MNSKFSLILFNLTVPVISSILIFDNINSENGELYYSLGLILTYLFARYVGRPIESSNYLKLLLPTIYLLIAVAINIKEFGINFYLLVHPVIYVYLVLLAGLFLKEIYNFEERRNAVLIVTFSFIIPASHKYHHLFTNPYIKKGFDFSIESDSTYKTDFAIDSISLELGDIIFYNRNKDSLRIQPDGRFTLLETWNEKCAPCLLAMKDLESFYQTDKFNQKYIYVRPDKRKDIDFEKLYESDIVIKKADRHLVDYTDNLYKNGIQGTPYFLLFDPNGRLVYKKIGYSSRQADLLIDEITRIISH